MLMPDSCPTKMKYTVLLLLVSALQLFLIHPSTEPTSITTYTIAMRTYIITSLSLIYHHSIIPFYISTPLHKSLTTSQLPLHPRHSHCHFTTTDDPEFIIFYCATSGILLHLEILSTKYNFPLECCRTKHSKLLSRSF